MAHESARRLMVVGTFGLAFAVACGPRPVGKPPRPTPAVRTPQTAQPLKGKRAKVRISWTAQSAQDLYGFNIYRGPSANGPWECVNTTPVLAAEGGTTNVPHNYEYIDKHESLVLGETYWYWLEAVESTGAKRRVWWPPPSITANVGIDEDFPPPQKK